MSPQTRSEAVRRRAAANESGIGVVAVWARSTGAVAGLPTVSGHRRLHPWNWLRQPITSVPCNNAMLQGVAPPSSQKSRMAWGAHDDMTSLPCSYRRDVPQSPLASWAQAPGDHSFHHLLPSPVRADGLNGRILKLPFRIAPRHANWIKAQYSAVPCSPPSAISLARLGSSSNKPFRLASAPGQRHGLGGFTMNPVPGTAICTALIEFT